MHFTMRNQRRNSPDFKDKEAFWEIISVLFSVEQMAFKQQELERNVNIVLICCFSIVTFIYLFLLPRNLKNIDVHPNPEQCTPYLNLPRLWLWPQGSEIVGEGRPVPGWSESEVSARAWAGRYFVCCHHLTNWKWPRATYLLLIYRKSPFVSLSFCSSLTIHLYFNLTLKFLISYLFTMITSSN